MSAPAPFRVLPLDAGYARRIRATRRDAFGQPVQERRDAEPHQCRVCLRMTAPDEACLLLAHRAHPEGALYAETGPLFIHARDCAPYADQGRFPPEMPARQLVLKAFSAAHEIVTAAHTGKAPIDEVIGRLFADPAVAYLHARNDTYGCFVCRIERA